MFCDQCGAQIIENDAFCSMCATPLGHADAVGVETKASIPDIPDKDGSESESTRLDSEEDSSRIQPLCVNCCTELAKEALFCPSCGVSVYAAEDSSVFFDSPESECSFVQRVAAGNLGSGKVKPRVNKIYVVGIVAAATLFLMLFGGIAFLLLNERSAESSSEEAGSSKVVQQDSSDSTKKEAQHELTTEQKAADGEAAVLPKQKPTTDTQEKKENLDANRFILPDSSSRYYKTAELSSLDNYNLYIARNEIFARHGRGFKNNDLLNYFINQTWYHQVYTPEEFDSIASPLNDYELKNAEVIRSIEESRKSPYLP